MINEKKIFLSVVWRKKSTVIIKKNEGMMITFL